MIDHHPLVDSYANKPSARDVGKGHKSSACVAEVSTGWIVCMYEEARDNFGRKIVLKGEIPVERSQDLHIVRHDVKGEQPQTVDRI